MKRAGNLWPRICNRDALMAAFHRASQGKHSHRACFQFSRALGANIEQLLNELESGSYRPRPLNRFWVRDGRKPRLIEAPAFRDLVVQHAIYAAISPALERRYIDTSFACRIGRGTHRASDWLQQAMRRAPRTAWVLHVDVRKFFYSIDRETLQAILERHLKCRRTLDLMALFALRPEPTGVPIGNLLSQTYANVYLNSLDHFCKRRLGVRDYARYMDDSVMLAPDQATGQQWLAAMREHLGLLGLEVSHYSLQPIRRGVDFVGYRTWARGRFVRKSLVTAIRRDARQGALDSIISRIASALRTRSLQHILTHLQEQHRALFDRLPQSLRRHHHAPAQAAPA